MAAPALLSAPPSPPPMEEDGLTSHVAPSPNPPPPERGFLRGRPPIRVTSEFDSERQLFSHRISCRVLDGLAKLRLRVHHGAAGGAPTPEVALMARNFSAVVDTASRGAVLRGTADLAGSLCLRAAHNTKALLNQAGSEISELKEQVQAKKDKREHAEKLSSDFEESVINLSQKLETTKAELEKQKENLTRRAEKAESELKLVAEELAALKHYISRLTIAVFGRRFSGNVEPPKTKLQAVYKFLEQLYVGGFNCIKSVKNVQRPPTRIMDMLNELSTVPEWFRELKMSAARREAMSALALAKAYHPEMDPALVAGGFPEFNADNTAFTKSDFHCVVKEIRYAGTVIAKGLDLSKFQVGYDENNNRMDMPGPKSFELIPPRKAKKAAQTGASSSSQVLSEEMVFDSLISMQWTEDEPPEADEDAERQMEENAEEPAKGDSAHAAAESAKASATDNLAV